MDYDFALDNKTDEEIIKIIRSGNEKAVDTLIERYKTLVGNKAKKFFILGSEAKDVYQEGICRLHLPRPQGTDGSQPLPERRVRQHRPTGTGC